MKPKKDYSTTIVVAILATIFISMFLLSCEKEERRDWQFKQLLLVYRAKCGPDSLSFIRVAESKTGDEMIALRNQLTFERWVKGSQLQKYYNFYLPDSLWVKSSILEWGYAVCRDTV